MEKPHASIKYHTLFPPMQDWVTSSSASLIDENKYFKNVFEQERVDEQLQGIFKEKFHPSMLAVLVDVQVTRGNEDLFIKVTMENCRNSLTEPGVYRFSLLRNLEDLSNFVLVEVYNSIEAPIDHKQTKHYKQWADSVKDIMERPRTAKKYRTLFPSLFNKNSPCKSTN